MRLLATLAAGGAGLVLAVAGAAAVAKPPALPRPAPGGEGGGRFAQVVPGSELTQRFGCTEFAWEPPAPDCPGGHFHSGIDLAAPAGRAVLAPWPGRAVSGMDATCGNYVAVEHAGGLRTLYCHLRLALVGAGAAVAAGEVVGEVGSTGASTGPHLHLELRRQGALIDPLPYVSQSPNHT